MQTTVTYPQCRGSLGVEIFFRTGQEAVFRRESGEPGLYLSPRLRHVASEAHGGLYYLAYISSSAFLRQCA